MQTGRGNTMSGRRNESPRCSNGDGRQVFRRSLCRACYDAIPHQERTPGGKVELGAVDVEPELVEAIAQAALREGITVALWRRRAYQEQLLRLATEAEEVSGSGVYQWQPVGLSFHRTPSSIDRQIAKQRAEEHFRDLGLVTLAESVRGVKGQMHG